MQNKIYSTHLLHMSVKIENERIIEGCPLAGEKHIERETEQNAQGCTRTKSAVDELRPRGDRR